MLQTILNLLGQFGNVVDLPGSSVRDLLTGNNPIDQWLTPTVDINRVSGRDVLSKWGLMRPNQETGMSGWLDDPGEGVRDVAGAAFESLFDPTNLIPAGWLGKALRGRKAASAANAAIGGKYGFVNPKVALRPDVTDVVEAASPGPMKLLGYTPEPELVYHGGHKWTNVSDTHPYGKPVINSGNSGEGNQAFGPGVYFAEDPNVTLLYKNLARQNAANSSQTLLDYFKPGNDIPGYIGRDKVVSFDPSTRSVTVTRDGEIRTHGTYPSVDRVDEVLGKDYLDSKVAQYGLTLPDSVDLVDFHSRSDPRLASLPDSPMVAELRNQIKDLLSRKFTDDLDVDPSWDAVSPSLQETLDQLKGIRDQIDSGSNLGSLRRIIGMHPSEASVSDMLPLTEIGIPGIMNASNGSRGTYNMNIWDQNVLDQMRVREINGEKVPWNLMLPIEQQAAPRVQVAPPSPLSPTMAQKQIPPSLRSPLAAGFLYNMLARQRGEL